VKILLGVGLVLLICGAALGLAMALAHSAVAGIVALVSWGLVFLLISTDFKD
jgi:hypothetical protein